MGAFYAVAETLCNHSLEGKPMAVGGLSMISTAYYEVCAIDFTYTCDGVPRVILSKLLRFDEV